MTTEQFERILDRAVVILEDNLRSSDLYHGPTRFAQHALDMLRVAAGQAGISVSPTYHAHAFPDIRVNGFGVEVKYSKHDTWRTIGNSIFEGMRDRSVGRVYVVFGKIGGTPEVRWRRYADCVTHVRVSNSPRFVLDMSEDAASLFKTFSLPYSEYATLSNHDKMRHVREYWRKRLAPGERLWWLAPDHTLPLNIRLYTNLDQHEKRRLRAEAAILCPQVCKGSRARGKYNDAVMYLLTYHGVLCPQARDLFSAGSVALQDDESRGGIYILRGLKSLEDEMCAAAERLDDELFREYWGESCPKDLRIAEWLVRADEYAPDWRPSEHLFLARSRP